MSKSIPNDPSSPEREHPAIIKQVTVLALQTMSLNKGTVQYGLEGRARKTKHRKAILPVLAKAQTHRNQ